MHQVYIVGKWLRIQVRMFELQRNICDLKAGKKVVLPEKNPKQVENRDEDKKEEVVIDNLELSNLKKHMDDLQEFSSNQMKVDVGKRFISEIKTMKNPPFLIMHLMTCICHMLKEEPIIVDYERNRAPIFDWGATALKMMCEVDFYNQLVNYDNFSQMDQGVYDLLCRRWGSNSGGWVMQNFNNQSNASAKLFEWVKCHMEIYALRMRYIHVCNTLKN